MKEENKTREQSFAIEPAAWHSSAHLSLSPEHCSAGVATATTRVGKCALGLSLVKRFLAEHCGFRATCPSRSTLCFFLGTQQGSLSLLPRPWAVLAEVCAPSQPGLEASH